MRLASLLVLEPATLTVVFSYSPSISEATDAVECSLAQQLRQGALPPCDAPVTLVCQDHPIALQRKGDLLYAVAAASTEDELGATELLSSVYRVVTAACEKEPPTSARLTSFYGKVVVCLHEAFGGQGYQLQRSLESILRNAKLKGPA